MTKPSPIRVLDRRGAASALDPGSGPSGRLLSPLSALYGAVAALHRGVYRSGLRSPKRLPRPVVSVGNIAVGGGGKTPLVLWLSASLGREGLKVAVLSRGYGRRVKKPQRVPVLGTNPAACQVFGDEPLLLAARLPDARVYVGADRLSAGLLALSEGDVDLFILDDGFSHHALERDFDLLAVDDRRRFGNGRLLPRGILREPLWRLSEADTVVVTKAERPDGDFTASIGRLSRAPVAWAGQRARGISRVGEGLFSDPAGFARHRFLVFSGIADPASFEATVDRLPLTTVGAVRFRDHHPYGEADVRLLLEEARSRGADALITTEKDAVRWPGCQGSLPVCYELRMELFFHEGGQGLLATITDILGWTR